ncbi:MAG: hypothetical protein ACXWV5_13420 [Flavitalea sp.]
MKEIPFDHNGQMLWIDVEMNGLYFISYTYQLWSSTSDTPPILTHPTKQGNNLIPHDDFHPVINDYNPTEIISRYVNRVIDVRFWIKKTEETDDGYNLIVSVFQGSSFGSSTKIGSQKVSGKVKALSVKEEFVIIKLV